MPSKRSSGAIALAALGLAGCTTTLSGNAPPSSGIAVGFAYQLPILTYDIESTRMLTNCPKGDEDLSFDVSVKATQSLVAGPPVIIDYEELDSALKITESTFARHPSGMLKSINAIAQDQTGQAVKAVAKAAVGIGKLAMGVVIPGAAAVAAPTSPPGPIQAPARVYVTCSKLGKTVVETYQAEKANLEKVTDDLASATAELANFDADHALDNPRSEETNKQRVKLAKAVRGAKTTVESQTKSYNAAKKRVSVIRHTSFTPAPGGVGDDRLTRDEADFFKSLQIVFMPEGAKDPAVEGGVIPIGADLTPDVGNARRGVDKVQLSGQAKQTVADAFDTFLTRSSLQISSRLLSIGGNGTGLPAQGKPCDPSNGKDRCGVVYYTAAMGRLQVCPNEDKLVCGSLLPTDPKVLLHEDRPVPQLGQMVSLSLKNGAWSNNSLTASFTEDGQIEQATYKKLTAEAVAALDSLNDGIGAASELAVYRANSAVRLAQGQQARDAASLAAFNAETNLVTAQMAREKAINEATLDNRKAAEALTTSELQQAQADTTLLGALKAKVDAEKALEAAKNPKP